MDIDDTIAIFLYHGLRDHDQKSGEYDQIHLGCIQFFQKCRIKGIPVLIRFRRNTDTLNTSLFSTFQGIGIWIVADDQGDLGIMDPPCFYRINDRLKIGTATGHTNCYS